MNNIPVERRITEVKSSTFRRALSGKAYASEAAVPLVVDSRVQSPSPVCTSRDGLVHRTPAISKYLACRFPSVERPVEGLVFEVVCDVLEAKELRHMLRQKLPLPPLQHPQ